MPVGAAAPVSSWNSRKTECGANQFLTRLAVRAAPFALLEELAQNGVRREPVPVTSGGARRTLCASLIRVAVTIGIPALRLER